MDALGKLFVLLLFAVVPSTLIVWFGWWVAGLIPADLKEAILTIVPYGVAGLAWVGLAWLGVVIATYVIE